jgi:uncharacterized protein (TIGR02996 family)
MTDHDAFVQAIIQQPDDDVPRLVYADWLEERNDPRGEFIRVQCELAKIPIDDPRWDALEQREWDLLRAHEEKWTADIKSLVSDWQFHRGFVDTVSMGARAFVDGAEKLFKRVPIRSLTLSRVGPSTVSGKELAVIPQLANLRSLNLKGNIQLPELKALFLSLHLKRLASLAVNCDDVDTLKTVCKSPLSSLEELVVVSMFSTSPLKVLAGKLPFSLKKLSLAQAGLNAEDIEQLASASGLASLTHLDLTDNSNLRVAGGQALANSKFLTNLTTLSLGKSKGAVQGCQIGLKGTQALANSVTLANLTSLDLCDNGLADSAVSAIVTSPTWPKLKELSLGSNKITTKGVESLVNWPGLERLNLLNLWVNYGVGDEGAKLLAESPRVANLLHLDLGYTSLTARGLLTLSKSPHLARLRHLNIEGNKVGDPGIQTLAKSNILAPVRVLNVARTGLGKVGAKALAESPHLKHLRKLILNGNKLDKATQQFLEERFGAGVCQFGQQ